MLGVASATELVAHMSGRLQRPVWEYAMRQAGLDEAEVAQALGIPLSTVWTRLHYARRDFAAAVKEGEAHVR